MVANRKCVAWVVEHPFKAIGCYYSIADVKINIPQPMVETLALSRQSFARHSGLLDMKIVPKILAVGLAVSLNMPRKVEAVPIVIAPLVCAKVCVLIGTAVVGGVTSYVWHNRTAKKKYFADIKGNVRKMLDDPEEADNSRQGDSGIWDEPIYAPTEEIAEQECREYAKLYQVSFVKVTWDGQTYRCWFEGEN